MAVEFNYGSRDLNGDVVNKIVMDSVEPSAISDLLTVNIEIRQQRNSLLDTNRIIDLGESVILSLPTLTEDHFISQESLPEDLKDEVEAIAIYLPSRLNGNKLSLSNAKLLYHSYSFVSDGPEGFYLGVEGLDTDAASHWSLPTSEFDGLWESLIFDEDIKLKLLRYINSTLLFFESGVSSNLLPWNKVIFLHGPPGTGKTSLCKALAQKISIRFSEKYSCGYFIEIHSHNLFSKWFSESGKLVSKLFEVILSLVEDQSALVILLIDEVETLAHSRKASISGGNDPSDGIRVVNALLTHLDKIKQYPNVLIMTTSNITEAVDMALVDRADIKQYIGLPCVDAIYSIYVSCIQELQRTGIVQSPNGEKGISLFSGDSSEKDMKLLDISRKSVGLSGRTIRKLPLLTHALYFERGLIPVSSFLDALYLAVDQQFKDRKNLSQDKIREPDNNNTIVEPEESK